MNSMKILATGLGAFYGGTAGLALFGVPLAMLWFDSPVEKTLSDKVTCGVLTLAILGVPTGVGGCLGFMSYKLSKKAFNYCFTGSVMRSVPDFLCIATTAVTTMCAGSFAKDAMLSSYKPIPNAKQKQKPEQKPKSPKDKP